MQQYGEGKMMIQYIMNERIESDVYNTIVATMILSNIECLHIMILIFLSAYLLTFLTLFTAAFSFLSHFFDAFCICFEVNRRFINSSSSETEFPMMTMMMMMIGAKIKKYEMQGRKT